MLIKRGKFYHYSFYINGQRVRGSTKQVKKAEATLVEAEILKQLTQDSGEEGKLFSAAAINYLNEVQDRSSLIDIERHIEFLQQHLTGIPLSDIDHAMVETIIQAKLAEGVSGATVNRLTATLKAILNKAKNQWRWIDSVPHIRRLKESKGCERFLSKAEAATLLAAAPEYLRNIITFALMTGQRKSNVLNIKWSQIDFRLKQWTIPASEFKNGHKFVVQLNDTALEILNKLKDNNNDYVFLNTKGTHVRCIKTAWRKTLKDADITDLRFHDLRHTWASWFLEINPSLVALKRAGGWRSEAMIFRYSHISDDSLSESVNRLEL